VLEFNSDFRERADIVVQSPLHTVHGNPTLLGQIFTNLIDNAVKYAKPGQRPTIKIRSEFVGEKREPNVEAGGDKHHHSLYRGDAKSSERVWGMAVPDSASPFAVSIVRLWVEDNGVGIDPKFHERIFGIFERLPGAEPSKGTGVGLAIVAKAVGRMKGRCGVESSLGHGSRFWIELPDANDK
jgi:signal transduction histidine kinase